MGVESFWNVLDMPFFIFILLFLSYIMWSKFINRNKLRINNINNILDISIIFLFLLTSIGGFVILAFSLIGIINLSFDWPLIIKISPYFIGGIGVLSVISIITSYRNKEANANNLEGIFKEVVKYYLVTATVIGAYLAFIFFTPLKTFLQDGLILTLFISIFVLGFCWNIVTSTLFGEKLDKFFTKKIIRGIIIIFIVGLILSFMIIPRVSQGELIHQKYFIFEAGKYNQETFLLSKANITLNSLGLINSFPNLIAINYGKYGLIATDSQAGRDFRVTSVSNLTGNTCFIDSFSELTKYGSNPPRLDGINNLELRENSFAIKFDREKFSRNEINYFILEGLVQANISENQFSYDDNVGDYEECYETGCRIKIQINNSLNMPVELRDNILENLNNRAVNKERISKCRFSRIMAKYNFNNEDTKYYAEDYTNEDPCIFGIRKELEDGYYEAFRIHLSNNEEGVLYRSRVYIEEPIQIELDIFVEC